MLCEEFRASTELHPRTLTAMQKMRRPNILNKNNKNY
jgi:hypothetical protein